ncbi:MAG TPA: TonB-dependent receptor [Rhizomicrobium sp.]|nr:TonB-dependent receptor [Rhizomicrobium sp.]
MADNLTLNCGLRYDAFQAYGAENQLSPRLNGVWKPTGTTTVHAGYARYFSPPPFELVASNDVALFNNTTAAGGGGPNDTPKAERADYYDLGMEQKISDAWTVGLDSFFDILNAFDEVYEIRDGTGVGVGAPQFGARRGFFVSLSKAL